MTFRGAKLYKISMNRGKNKGVDELVDLKIKSKIYLNKLEVLGNLLRVSQDSFKSTT